jgi:hypothetical protein
VAGRDQSVNIGHFLGMKSMRQESDAETHAHSQNLREMEEHLAEVSHEVLWSAMSPRIALNISLAHETITRPDAGINPLRAE